MTRQTRHLARDPRGFWTARAAASVSYPKEGNENAYCVEDNSWWYQHRNRVIVEVLRRYPPPQQGPIFDIGGGNGYVARGLEEAGFSTVVVEPGETGATNACRRGLKNVICASVEASRFDPASLPGVGLFDVIEHIEDDVAFLRSLRPLLQPGGRIYLTVPAYQWLWSSEDSEGGHYRRYTLRSLRRLIARAGLTLDFDTYFFSAVPLPLFFLRTLPSRLGRRPKLSLEVIRKEHEAQNGLGRRCLQVLLNGELKWLARGRRLLTGGSCLAVASCPST